MAAGNFRKRESYLGRMMNDLRQTFAWMILVFIGGTASAVASDVQGFTEPYRHISVPAPEIGVIGGILVQEGDEVRQGQIVAQMEDDVLKATLEVARKAKDATGSLQSAQIQVRTAKKQLSIYQALNLEGNATPREIEYAETELQQAEARLLSVREELEVRRLEFEKTKAELKQRQIQAPFDGIVQSIDKERGEFVSPTDPVIMQLVQLDQLRCVFPVPLASVSRLESGLSVNVSIGQRKQKIVGVIEFVSPVTNAQTGTVEVRVKIPNPGFRMRSGEPCKWDLSTGSRIKPPNQADTMLRRIR